MSIGTRACIDSSLSGWCNWDMNKASKIASELSQLGAAKGGRARAESLTPEQRSEISRKAVLTRWQNAGKVPAYVLAKYGAADRPLRIGNVQIPCYVLADGRRVLAQRGLQGGIGLSEGGGHSGARRIVELMTRLHRKGFDVKNLVARANSPIHFILPHGGNPADGYEATILPDICAVIIEANQRGGLDKRLTRLATRCAELQHGFATVGIIALVDEATGYQDYRARDSLAKILERYVEKDLQPWVKTFPAEYYKEIYRLNGWQYAENSGKPGVIGHWTNNIVYKRLAPGVLEELRKRTPRDNSGRLKNKLFQWLTEDHGHPKLREHLTGAVMLMKYSRNMRVFFERLDKEYPQWGETMPLPFPDDYEGPN